MKTRHLTLSLCTLLFSAPCLADSSSFDQNSGSTTFPGLVKASSKKVSRGKVCLPFILNLAERPELMHPQYLRMVLGSPEQARAYSYPANNFSWTPADGSRTSYYLSRVPHNQINPSASFSAAAPVAPAANASIASAVVLEETRQFVVTFRQSLIRHRDVRSKLGKPTRRFYDNQAQPVELFQITPATTIAVCEPINTFDVSRITVTYKGPVLAPVGQKDLFTASNFRQEQIDHHLSRGDRNRGLGFLQEHLDDNPQDIEAHLLLAETLKNRSDVNGSIAEYRRALALAQGSHDSEMQRKALHGLKQFGLVPPAVSSTVDTSYTR